MPGAEARHAPLAPGAVVWADLDPVRGREQAGRRPSVVVSSAVFLDVVTTLVMVTPVTTVDRSWPNHILLTGPAGLAHPGWAMTEQVRTISRDRLAGTAGLVDPECLSQIRLWIADFLDLSVP